jgi:hypothetical protein
MTDPAPVSKAALWTGRVMSVVPSLLLLMSGVMKLTRSPQVVEGFAHLGLPENLIVPIGVLEIGCALVYLVPRTSVLGAILLTGYMGGTIVTHLRVGEPPVVQALLGVVFWGGLYLRDPRIRALIPLKR